MVVAHLGERLLPTPEVCGLQPSRRRIFKELSTVLKRRKLRKRGQEGPNKNKSYGYYK